MKDLQKNKNKKQTHPKGPSREPFSRGGMDGGDRRAQRLGRSELRRAA